MTADSEGWVSGPDGKPRENILEEANRLTSQDRRGDYGHPADHHGKTAAVLTVLLQGRLKDGEAITSRDWQRFMIVDKLVRDTNRPKRDNLVDIVGYARTAEMVEEAQEAKDSPFVPRTPLTLPHLTVEEHDFCGPHYHEVGSNSPVPVKWRGNWVPCS